jgi:hypothetical protein
MNIEEPLNLGSLGDVDSPEVIREALRRFRRRALRTAVWVVLVVLAIGTFVLGSRAQRNLGDDIADAPGVTPAAVYRVEGMTAILVKVADLGDRTGIHLLVAQAGNVPQKSNGSDTYQLTVDPSLEISHTFTFDRERVYDFYFDPRVPADARLRLDVHLGCSGYRELELRSPVDRPYRPCSIQPRPKDPIGSFVIDLHDLGIPESIWKKG